MLVASPWLWRNWRLWDDPLGWPLVLATIDRRTGPLIPADFVWLLAWLVWEFLGQVWRSRTSAVALPVLRGLGRTACRRGPGLAVAATAASDTGNLRGWLGHPSGHGGHDHGRNYLLQPHRALGTDQGRLLFPAVAPIALLITGGIAVWLPAARMRWLPVGMSVGMAAAALLALAVGIAAPYASPSGAAGCRDGPRHPSGRDVRGWSGVRGCPLGLQKRGRASWRRSARRSTGERHVRWPRTCARRCGCGMGRAICCGSESVPRRPGASARIVGRLGAWCVTSMPCRRTFLAGAARIELGVQPFPAGDWLPVGGQPGTQFLPLPAP